MFKCVGMTAQVLSESLFKLFRNGRSSGVGIRSFGTTTDLGTAEYINISLGVTAVLKLDFTADTLVTNELITVTASYIAQGSYGTLNQVQYPLSGYTASASLTAGNYPDDDYQVIIDFVQGGTLGVAGIQYKVSISGALSGQDWSQTYNLGTALTILVPGTGTGGISGALVTLGTGAQTIGTGAVLSFRCYAPNFNTASVSAAINALFQIRQSWERAVLAGTFDAGDTGMAQAIDAIFASNFSNGIDKEKSWIANFRMQKDQESTATYMTQGQLFTTNLNGSLFFGSICFGDCKLTSAITGYLHKRPVAMLVGCELAIAGLSIDIARTDRPGLPCLLTDSNGNPDCYDDGLYNGTMDGYQFIALRGDQPEGIFVANPRMFVAPGTDIPMTYHRDLLNLHTRYAKDALRKELSVGLRANVTTGLLTEDEYDTMETKVNTLENGLLVNPGYISGQKVSVSRTDNLNNQPVTMHVSGKFVSLIYPKTIVWTDQIVASL